MAGLDDIRPFSFQMGKVPIYGLERVLDVLKQRFAYVFEEKNKYPGAPSIACNIVGELPFDLGNMKVIPIKVMHGDLEILGYRFNKFAYLTDVKTICEKELEKLRNLDVLVINALRLDSHRTHLNLEESLNIIKQLNPKKAYITHISHKLGFHKEVEKILPKNVYLAYDGLEIIM